MDKPKTIRDYVRRKLSEWMGLGRDYNKALGYPTEVDATSMREMYKRSLGKRIVDAYPKACWKVAPTVEGDENFVASLTAMEERLELWATLARLDRLSGIGRFGILVLGFNDGGALSDALDPVEGMRLAYIQPYGEDSVEINAWENDPKSPRFGKPVMYQVTRRYAQGSMVSFSVHHSRVIHVAEDALDDTSIGTSRLEACWDRLIDLTKLLGGSAEIYWLNAAAFYHMNAESDVEWEPGEGEEIKKQIEEVQDGLSRFIRTRGVDVAQVSPGLMGSDPNGHIEKQFDVIAGITEIPKRILLGSEAGELASSQDENNWHNRTQERRQLHVIPNIVRAFIKKMQAVGVLPAGLHDVFWSDSDTLGEEKRADIALKKAQVVATYGNTLNGDVIVSLAEVRRWLGENGKAPLTDLEEDALSETGDDRDYFEHLKSNRRDNE